MFIVYFDESGDDGIPGSSPFYVKAGVCVNSEFWFEINKDLYNFRVSLENKYGFAINKEIHTKEILKGARGYEDLTKSIRVEIVDRFWKFVCGLDVKFVFDVVVKDDVDDQAIISVKRNKNHSLVQCKKYFIVGNTMKHVMEKLNSLFKEHIMMISDEGRIKKLVVSSRHIVIKEKYKIFVDDPLGKNSKDSFFLQIADCLAYIVYSKFAINKNIKRRKRSVSDDKIEEWYDYAQKKFL